MESTCGLPLLLKHDGAQLLCPLVGNDGEELLCPPSLVIARWNSIVQCRHLDVQLRPDTISGITSVARSANLVIWSAWQESSCHSPSEEAKAYVFPLVHAL